MKEQIWLRRIRLLINFPFFKEAKSPWLKKKMLHQVKVNLYLFNDDVCCLQTLTINSQQFARSARPKQDNTDTKRGPKQRWTQQVSETPKHWVICRRTLKWMLIFHYVIVYIYSMYRTSLILVTVLSFYICVYTLFIQDAKAWYCGPAEPFVSLFWHILWKKKTKIKWGQFICRHCGAIGTWNSSTCIVF